MRSRSLRRALVIPALAAGAVFAAAPAATAASNEHVLTQSAAATSPVSGLAGPLANDGGGLGDLLGGLLGGSGKNPVNSLLTNSAAAIGGILPNGILGG